MSRLRSIPLASVVDGAPTGGTGFLVWDGKTYLVTVAHLPTLQMNPQADWSVWHPRLYVGGDPARPVELFGGSAFGPAAAMSARTPRFHFYRFADQPDRLVDVIVLPFRTEWSWAAEYEPIDLTNTRVPAVGETLHLAGYPTSVANWPELQNASGSLLGLSGYALEIAVHVAGGFSGSPVLADDGAFMGILYGTGDPEQTNENARAIPPGFITAAMQSVNGYLPDGATVNAFEPNPTPPGP